MAAGLAALLGLAGCAGTPPPACPSGSPMLVFDLFFGRAIAGRPDLTEAEWQGFVNDTVSVNLPDGYTVVDGSGAWTNPRSHATVREATRIILVALPDRVDSVSAVERIRAAYDVRFHQQSVGMVVTRGCGAF